MCAGGFYPSMSNYFFAQYVAGDDMQLSYGYGRPEISGPSLIGAMYSSFASASGGAYADPFVQDYLNFRPSVWSPFAFTTYGGCACGFRPYTYWTYPMLNRPTWPGSPPALAKDTPPSETALPVHDGVIKEVSAAEEPLPPKAKKKGGGGGGGPSIPVVIPGSNP